MTRDLHRPEPASAAQPRMNLYRVMTDVRAGSGLGHIAPGTVGIVTMWVRAASEPLAIAGAERVFNTRQYQSTGRLAVYLEQTAVASPSLETGSGLGDAGEDTVSRGYEAIKRQALEQADGLFEAWLSPREQRLFATDAETAAA